MNGIAQALWLIPALPLVAAAVGAVLKQRQRRLGAVLAIGSMVLALALSCVAMVHVLQLPGHGSTARQVVNFFWFQFGDPQISETALRLGWVLDPLAAVMLVMVSLVGLLIFIYSLGYMEHDENFTRFFCFLSLFASAMLGLVIANSLLLLFICWEIVGLTSYLLIGFWYHKPSAAAAAKKAILRCYSVWCGSIRKRARCFSTTAATAVWNKPRWPSWWRKPRAWAWPFRLGSGC
jgi:NADH-quinone oxidoreductase subunit L